MPSMLNTTETVLNKALPDHKVGSLIRKKILFLIKSERNQRYGILSLAAFLKERGHTLDYIFINVEEQLSQVLKKIEIFKPDYLAISAMSGEVMFYLTILKKIKEKFPEQYVIMGGPHPTYDISIIKNKYIDAICSGEGEEAFAEFLEKHPHGDFYSVKNFSFKTKNGEVIKNPL